MGVGKLGGAVLLIAAGTVIGLLIPHVRSGSSTPARYAEPEPPPATVPMGTASSSPAAAPTGARVQPRLEAVGSAPSSLGSTPIPPTRESAAAIERREHASLLLAHSKEPRDSAWAPGEERKISQAFQELGEGVVAKVGKIECLSASCTVDLSWPSYGAALGEGGKLVANLGKSVTCGRRLTLPDADGAAKEISATLYVDCAEARWGPTEVPPAR